MVVNVLCVAVEGSAWALCWAQPHRAPSVSAGDLPPATTPPMTTTSRAPPQNVGTSRADAAVAVGAGSALWGQNLPAPLLHLLYGVKSCLWKGILNEH